MLTTALITSQQAADNATGYIQPLINASVSTHENFNNLTLCTTQFTSISLVYDTGAADEWD